MNKTPSIEMVTLSFKKLFKFILTLEITYYFSIDIASSLRDYL